MPKRPDVKTEVSKIRRRVKRLDLQLQKIIKQLNSPPWCQNPFMPWLSKEKRTTRT
jgi:hypothetical protein